MIDAANIDRIIKYVVMDMNRGFRDVARTFFRNAVIIIECEDHH